MQTRRGLYIRKTEKTQRMYTCRGADRNLKIFFSTTKEIHCQAPHANICFLDPRNYWYKPHICLGAYGLGLAKEKKMGKREVMLFPETHRKFSDYSKTSSFLPTEPWLGRFREVQATGIKYSDDGEVHLLL